MIRYCFVLILLFSSCQKIDDGEVIHKIAKGKHYSDNRYVAKGYCLNTWVRIDESWIYEEKSPAYNKLIGFSHGLDPQKNSARIAWRCVDNKLCLAAMFHRNGNSPEFIYLKEVVVGQWCMVRVWFEWFNNEGSYNICVDGVCAKKVGYKYKQDFFLCHPYFGGNDTAPHDMFFVFRFI